ncbi:hypothetical protein PTTG_12080 [Puccinia triticina 1-1 BBBD Race 1]|uniref:Secreted protein n=2 Tax=Puccinia triticina TaxID=208348 RepID=A0A180GR87_PUCT1|nr:uncharacterized protein PtA15_3A530 [Puccinia triticina]OAV95336.1 hypothetical protein PTTG_12080 [Puccinia triticina 1-1 BBBD Race 1]WAQ83162.1 hypothetical protein PtA15_3A530 [Puccinia triticina]WAR54004.1 hypothetical protein PtB15_3B514 [Puccinia triticina]
MFPAGSIWKLYFVSAAIALVGLPAVELAEIQRQALSRRAPMPDDGVRVKGSIECGDSWATQQRVPLGAFTKQVEINLQRASCRGYDAKGYNCVWSSCKAKKKNGVIPLQLIQFVDCVRAPNPGEAGGFTPVKFMRPLQIWAKNLDGLLVAVGVDSDSDDPIVRRYGCTWSLPESNNNFRPYCDECYHTTFQEPPPPLNIG